MTQLYVSSCQWEKASVHQEMVGFRVCCIAAAAAGTNPGLSFWISWCRKCWRRLWFLPSGFFPLVLCSFFCQFMYFKPKYWPRYLDGLQFFSEDTHWWALFPNSQPYYAYSFLLQPQILRGNSSCEVLMDLQLNPPAPYCSCLIILTFVTWCAEKYTKMKKWNADHWEQEGRVRTLWVFPSTWPSLHMI